MHIGNVVAIHGGNRRVAIEIALERYAVISILDDQACPPLGGEVRGNLHAVGPTELFLVSSGEAVRVNVQGCDCTRARAWKLLRDKVKHFGEGDRRGGVHGKVGAAEGAVAALCAQQAVSP